MSTTKREESAEVSKKRMRYDSDGYSSPIASSVYGRYSSPPTSLPACTPEPEKIDLGEEENPFQPTMGTFDTSDVGFSETAEMEAVTLHTIVSPRKQISPSKPKSKVSPVEAVTSLQQTSIVQIDGILYDVLSLNLHASQTICIGRPTAEIRPGSERYEKVEVPHKYTNISRNHCCLRVADSGLFAVLTVEGRGGVEVYGTGKVVGKGKRAKISWEDGEDGFEMILAKQLLLDITIIFPETISLMEPVSVLSGDSLQTPKKTQLYKYMAEDSPLSPVPSAISSSPIEQFQLTQKEADYSSTISKHFSKSSVPLEGMIASVIVFSSKGCVPESEVIRGVLEDHKDLLALISRTDSDMEEAVEIWRPFCLAILRKSWNEGGFFGRIGNQGLKDAEGRDVESTYYYIPEQDPDAARAKELVDFVRPVRENRKSGGKQYFWKKVAGKKRKR